MDANRLFPESARIPALTARQLDSYSLADLIAATARDDQGRLRFYREISDEVQERTGAVSTSPRAYFLPSNYVVRDMTAAGVSGSNYLVGSPVVGFASGLFANSLIAALPLRLVPMQGNGTITASTATPTITWLSDENTAADDAAMAFGSRALAIKSVAITGTISHQLERSTNAAASAFVEQQFGQRLAEAAGTALVDGTGASGQPLGLLRLAGTTSTSGTTLGASGLRDLLAAVEGYTAGSVRFVLGVTAAKLLRSREVATGAGLLLTGDNRIFGVPAIVSRCMPADALLVADFGRVSWATWGPIEAVVSPVSSPTAFRAGAVGVRLRWDMDFVADFPAIVGKSMSIT